MLKSIGDMKKKTIKWIKLVLKYLIPVVLGWLEGDSHAVANGITEFIALLF